MVQLSRLALQKYIQQETAKADVKEFVGTGTGKPQYALAEQKQPTYEEVVQKNPMTVVGIGTNSEGKTFAELQADALRTAEENGWLQNPLHNEDTDSLWFINGETISHARNSVQKEGVNEEGTLLALAHLDEIVQDARLIAVNDPKNTNKAEKRVHTFFGAVRQGNQILPVKLQVKEYAASDAYQLPQNVQRYVNEHGEISEYGKLYDVVALEVLDTKKETTDATGEVPGLTAGLLTTSDVLTISVANLLDLVKGDAAKYIPPKTGSNVSAATADSAGVPGLYGYQGVEAARWGDFALAEKLAKRFGAKFRVSEFENRAEGSYKDGTVTISPTAPDPVMAVLFHELTHHMERSGLYGDFASFVLKFARSNMGADLGLGQRNVTAEYAAEKVDLTTEGADKELVAHFVQEFMFHNEMAIRRLVQAKPTLGERILNWIQDIKTLVKGTKYERFMLKAETMYKKALEDVAKNGVEKTGETEYLFAGRNAKTADLGKLAEAESLAAAGVDRETIRQKTGWFRGDDGQWRFEIDDSKMVYHRSGDARFLQDHPEYARHQELTQKLFDGTITEAEYAELRKLDETWGRERSRLAERVARGNATLENLIDHPELFAAYPELRDAKVVFGELDSQTKGEYDRTTNTITIREDLRNAPDETLIHEIQHAVQKIEGFAGGSSVEYWQAKIDSGEVQTDATARELYDRTAGENEARDAARRRGLTAEERKNTSPRLLGEDAVFAEDAAKAVEINKYYKRIMEKWDGVDRNGYFRMGTVSKPLQAVGFPAQELYFDESKAAEALKTHKELTPIILAQIPKMLENPIAISYHGGNNINVFGHLYDEQGRPIMVGVRMNCKARGANVGIVSKVRTVELRTHDFANKLNDDNVLYLNPNKKETLQWFQAIEESIPLGGTKFGLIRSISDFQGKSNPKVLPSSSKEQNAIGSSFSELTGMENRERELRRLQDVEYQKGLLEDGGMDALKKNRYLIDVTRATIAVRSTSVRSYRLYI